MKESKTNVSIRMAIEAASRGDKVLIAVLTPESTTAMRETLDRMAPSRSVRDLIEVQEIREPPCPPLGTRIMHDPYTDL